MTDNLKNFVKIFGTEQGLEEKQKLCHWIARWMVQIDPWPGQLRNEKRAIVTVQLVAPYYTTS